MSRWLVVSRLAELASQLFSVDDLIEHPVETSETRRGIARMRQTGEVVTYFYDPRSRMPAVYRLDHIDPPREHDKRSIEEKMVEAMERISGEFTCESIGVHPSTIYTMWRRGVVAPVATMGVNGVVGPYTPRRGGRTVWRLVREDHVVLGA